MSARQRVRVAADLKAPEEAELHAARRVEDRQEVLHRAEPAEEPCLADVTTRPVVRNIHCRLPERGGGAPDEQRLAALSVRPALRRWSYAQPECVPLPVDELGRYFYRAGSVRRWGVRARRGRRQH